MPDITPRLIASITLDKQYIWGSLTHEAGELIALSMPLDNVAAWHAMQKDIQAQAGITVTFVDGSDPTGITPSRLTQCLDLTYQELKKSVNVYTAPVGSSALEYDTLKSYTYVPEWDLIPKADAAISLAAGKIIFFDHSSVILGLSLHSRGGEDLKEGLTAWVNSRTFPFDTELLVDSTSYTLTISALSVYTATSTYNPRVSFTGTPIQELKDLETATSGVIRVPAMAQWLADNGYGTPSVNSLEPNTGDVPTYNTVTKKYEPAGAVPYQKRQALVFTAEWDLIPSASASTGLPTGSALFKGDDASLHPFDKNGIDLTTHLQAWVASLSLTENIEYTIDGVPYYTDVTSVTDSLHIAPSDSNPRLWLKGDSSNTGIAEVTSGVISYPAFNAFVLANYVDLANLETLEPQEGEILRVNASGVGEFVEDTALKIHPEWTDGPVAATGLSGTGIGWGNIYYEVSKTGMVSFEGYGTVGGITAGDFAQGGNVPFDYKASAFFGILINQNPDMWMAKVEFTNNTTFRIRNCSGVDSPSAYFSFANFKYQLPWS